MKRIKGRAGANIRGTVKIEGLDDLLRKLGNLGAEVSKELTAAVEEGAEIIQEAAISLAPGPEIGIEVEESTATRAQVAIGPEKDKWYYRFFEFGAVPHDIIGSPHVAFEGREGLFVGRGAEKTGGVPAEPFLRPAFDANKDKARDRVGEVLAERIEELAKRKR